MALTGIQIFKLLPKTNCGDCGVPTCLAFAMNLAAGKAELSKCPFVSEASKAQLAVESAPPIRTVEIGSGANVVKVGGETVLFRHEKTFFNKTGIAVRIADDEPAEAVAGKLDRFNKLRYVRVGLTLRAEMVSVAGKTGDPAKLAALVEKVVAGTDAALILESEKPAVLEAGVKAAKDRKPLLCGATEANADEVAKLAKESGGLPVVAKADGLAAVSALATKLAGAGLKDIVLDPGSRGVKAALRDEVAIRRLATQKRERSVGYPTITFPCDMAPGDIMKETVVAGLLIPKYAGIVVLSDLRGESLFPLLLERLNIYTDPQRPMKTEQGIYEFNHPTATSPVLITSNFSLTYFIVSGEIENSRIPAWLLVLDTDGLSVLTAWAAGKFVGDTVGPFVKKSGIADKLEKRSLVLPGMAAVISGDVEEELGKDWEVMIGPREATHLPAYLRQKFTA